MWLWVFGYIISFCATPLWKAGCRSIFGSRIRKASSLSEKGFPPAFLYHALEPIAEQIIIPEQLKRSFFLFQITEMSEDLYDFSFPIKISLTAVWATFFPFIFTLKRAALWR